MGEKSSWANSTPENGRRGEYGDVRANEEILLVGRADAGNVIQGPVLCHNYRNNHDRRGEDLAPKDEAWWDFHIISEF